METLYNFLSSDAFPIILVVWTFIAVFWIERWRKVLSRIIALLKEPLIFKQDYISDIPLYPRSFFSESANKLRDILQDPFSKMAKAMFNAVKFVIGIAYEEEHKIRIFGYLLFFSFFIAFVLADAIAVANTLFILGFLEDVPALLGRFDIAVFGGSLLALISSIELVIFELQGDRSILTNFSDKGRRQRTIALALSFIVLVLSIFTLIVWALARLIKTGEISSSPFLDGIVQWTLYGIVPVNSAFAAGIIFLQAVFGFLLITSAVLYIIVVTVRLLNYLAKVIGSFLPYAFDVIYRVVYIALDVTFWFVFTPVFVVRWFVDKIVGMFSSDDGATKNSSPNT
jgi:hypothetical protein